MDEAWLTVDFLKTCDRPAPRYTSYPTAPEWGAFSSESYEKKLQLIGKKEGSISLYFHIPFCKSMCLFCGCSVILNRKEDVEERYVAALIEEIKLVSSLIGVRKKVSQLHFGGGTPTKLSIPLFKKLKDAIDFYFDVDPNGEIAIEIDPRTVCEDEGKKLQALKEMGFNRVSFGVQDTDPTVQEAIKRRQSLQMTQKTMELAKNLGFLSINVDLIYGLPFQTPATFSKTIDAIIDLLPDRIALFSYAKVPWLKAHQKAIKDETLPPVEAKFQIYIDARKKLIQAGYIPIGMDHFSKNEDELSVALKEGRLQRNFQGYSLKLAQDQLGLGVTAVGALDHVYVQNVKELSSYYHCLENQVLPVLKGHELTLDDQIRRDVIHTLMCKFLLNKSAFEKKWAKKFDDYFEEELKSIREFETKGFIHNDEVALKITERGALFVRLVAMSFDVYTRKRNAECFSKAV